MDVCIYAGDTFNSEIPWPKFVLSKHFNEWKYKTSDCRVNMERHTVAQTDFGDLLDVIHHAMRILRGRTHNHHSITTNLSLEILNTHFSSFV